MAQFEIKDGVAIKGDKIMSFSEIDIIKYAIEGDNATKLYEIVVYSRTYREFLDRIKLDYRNGVLIVTLVSYSDTDFYHFTDFTLPFIIGKADYELGYSIDLNSGKIADWRTNDTEGKYFNIPNELQMVNEVLESLKEK